MAPGSAKHCRLSRRCSVSPMGARSNHRTCCTGSFESMSTVTRSCAGLLTNPGAVARPMVRTRLSRSRTDSGFAAVFPTRPPSPWDTATGATGRAALVFTLQKCGIRIFVPLQCSHHVRRVGNTIIPRRQHAGPVPGALLAKMSALSSFGQDYLQRVPDCQVTRPYPLTSG